MTRRARARPIVWTEAHQREALRRRYELAAELESAGFSNAARMMASREWVVIESDWRRQLAGDAVREGGEYAPTGFAWARIDREVRRVDALATGRLVRETRCTWVVDHGHYEAVYRRPASEPAPRGGRLIKRVTRIRWPS